MFHRGPIAISERIGLPYSVTIAMIREGLIPGRFINGNTGRVSRDVRTFTTSDSELEGFGHKMMAGDLNLKGHK